MSVQGPIGPQGAAGPQGPAGVVLVAYNQSQTNAIANAASPSALVKMFSFATPLTGAVKVSWDDYRIGIFGVAGNSMCEYRAYIDDTQWGGTRRLEVDTASSVPTTEHGTYTFFGPALSAGNHTFLLYVLSGANANCYVGWGNQNAGGSSIIVELFPTN